MKVKRLLADQVASSTLPWGGFIDKNFLSFFFFFFQVLLTSSGWEGILASGIELHLDIYLFVQILYLNF